MSLSDYRGWIDLGSNNGNNLHSGHRQRVKKRFITNGLSGFSDHEALELLLYYSIPQKDTNELAHVLINEFGSLDGVLSASVDALTSVKGVGESTAVLIKLVSSIYLMSLEIRTDRAKVLLDSSEKSSEYFLPLLAGYQNEVLMAVFLDNNLSVKKSAVLAHGDLSRLEINFGKIITTAVNCNSNRIIIAHNHPSGVAAPSAADVEAVRQMSVKLKSVGIRLCDSIIVAGTECFSMAQHDKYKYYFG